MEKLYKEIIDFMILSGKRITKRAGQIKDIGITKKDLTEEDLRIERGLKRIIKNFDKTCSGLKTYIIFQNDNI